MKFVRRKELDADTRLKIVLLALACQGVYGARTMLAREYNLSRSFLYQLISAALLCLHEFFHQENVDISAITQLELDANIALLRLEGKVSISAISEILRIPGYDHYSTGMVSERLKSFAQNLSSTLSTTQPCQVFYLSDEIFASDLPILITIDPISTAILHIELALNRSAKTWQEHFEALHEQRFIPEGLGSDRGNGIVPGYQASYQNAVWCSDHFHEFRGLTQLCSRLEKQAYAAIAAEDERLWVFNHARSEKNLTTRLQQLHEATQICELKIEQYQHVNDVLALLFSCRYFFDPQSGKPRFPLQVKTDVLTLMDLLDELELPKLQTETQKIRAHIDDICNCYKQVESSYRQLSKTIPAEQLDYIG